MTLTITDGNNNAAKGIEAMATTGTGYNHQDYKVPTGIKGTTDANGQITLNLPQGFDYKFRLKTNSYQIYNSSVVCTPLDPATQPASNCATQAISLPGVGQVGVTLTDEANAVKVNAVVYAYEGNTYAGQAVTDANGVAQFALPGNNCVFGGPG